MSLQGFRSTALPSFSVLSVDACVLLQNHVHGNIWILTIVQFILLIVKLNLVFHNSKDEWVILKTLQCLVRRRLVLSVHRRLWRECLTAITTRVCFVFWGFFFFFDFSFLYQNLRHIVFGSSNGITFSDYKDF